MIQFLQELDFSHHRSFPLSVTKLIFLVDLDCHRAISLQVSSFLDGAVGSLSNFTFEGVRLYSEFIEIFSAEFVRLFDYDSVGAK